MIVQKTTFGRDTSIKWWKIEGSEQGITIVGIWGRTSNGTIIDTQKNPLPIDDPKSIVIFKAIDKSSI
jgi:hypothetical protein